MQGIDLGTVYSSYKFDASQMATGIAEAVRQLNDLASKAGTASKQVATATNVQTKALSDEAIQAMKTAQAVKNLDQAIREGVVTSGKHSAALKEQMNNERAALKAVEDSKTARLKINSELERSDLALAKIRKGLTDQASARGAWDPSTKTTKDPLTEMYGLRSTGSIFSNIGSQMASIGDRGIGALVGIVKTGADLNQTLLQIRNNTTMTDAEFANMTQETKKLGVETGAAMGQIAMGARHIKDYGFTGRDAMDQLTVATKAAVATNTDAGDTAQLLSRVMKIFQIDTSKAAGAMNTLWYASANSNLMMNQLVGTGSRTFAMAGPLGVKFEEAAAAMSVFAGNGLNASQAATQLLNDMNKLHKPTKQVSDYLDYLASKSGPDLRNDFTLTGIKTRQISGIFQDVAEKARAMGVPVAELVTHLFPNLRGETGALIGTTATGLAGMKTRLSDIADMMEGRVDPLTARYAQTQGQLGISIARLNNAWTVMASSISEKLLPAILPLVGFVQDLVVGIGNLPDAVKTSGLALAGIAAVALTVGGRILELVGTVYQLRAAMIAIKTAGLVASLAGAETAAVGAATTIGGLGPLLLNPWVLAAAAVAALAGGLYYLTHNTNEAAKSAKDLADEAVKGAHLNTINALKIQDLAAEYDALTKKTNWTTEESKRFQDINAKIAKMSPDLVVGFDDQGNAMLRLDVKIAKVGTSAAMAAEQLKRLASVQITTQQNAEQYNQITAEIKSRQYQLDNNVATRDVYVQGSYPGVGGIQTQVITATQQDRNATIKRMLALQAAKREKEAYAAEVSTNRYDATGALLPSPMDIANNIFGVGTQSDAGTSADEKRWREQQKAQAKAAREAAAEARRGASAAAKEADQAAEKKKDAIKRSLEEIFRLTHTDYEMQRQDAEDHYKEQVDAGGRRLEFARQLALKLGKINDDESKVTNKLIAEANKVRRDRDEDEVDKIIENGRKIYEQIRKDEESLARLKESVGRENDRVNGTTYQRRIEIEQDYKTNLKVDPELAQQSRNQALSEADKVDGERIIKSGEAFVERIRSIVEVAQAWAARFIGLKDRIRAADDAVNFTTNQKRYEIEQQYKVDVKTDPASAKEMYDKAIAEVNKQDKAVQDGLKDRLRAGYDAAHGTSTQRRVEIERQYQIDLKVDADTAKKIREQSTKQVDKEELEKTRNRLKNSLGGMLGVELAYGLADGFAKTLDKAFGKSDIGKIFSRVLTKVLDKAVDSGVNSLFDMIAKGGKKSSGGSSGGGGILGGILGGIFGGGGGGILGGLSSALSIFGFADGGVIPGPIGKGRLVYAHSGETVLPTHKMSSPAAFAAVGMGGHTTNHMPVTIHATVSNDYDVRDLAYKLSRHIERLQPARPRR